MLPTFFRSSPDFRDWLAEHHEHTSELVVGFYKKGSGRPSMTWPESVDAALCFGWIDGVRRGIDDDSYAIRFTPRRPRSRWSAVNIRRATELTRLGLMQAAGSKAFAGRDQASTERYSYEQRKLVELPVSYRRKFRARAKAWTFFQAQPAGYRHTAIWWVVNAKREDTRLRRLLLLIEDSEHGRPIAPLRRKPKSG